MKNEDDLLRVDEVARLLGITTVCLGVWRMRGKGPKFLKLDNDGVRYRKSDVLTYLREREIRPARKPQAKAS